MGYWRTPDDFIIALGGDESDSSDSNEEEEENSSDDPSAVRQWIRNIICELIILLQFYVIFCLKIKLFIKYKIRQLSNVRKLN
jgi:hypothetical protein